MLPIILASVSKYRRQVLDKLNIKYTSAAPEADEITVPGEAPSARAERLSRAKALSLAGYYPHHLIIGSDQVAQLDDEILSKPGDYPQAFRQLSRCSGKRVIFHTGICVFNSASGRVRYRAAVTGVKYRHLQAHTIESYLLQDRPYDCAGSIKSEGLGICLLESISGDDPNALVGLPLIELVNLLAEENIPIPALRE